MSFPVTTPCGDNFCKECLTGKFDEITQVRERSRGGCTLHAQRHIMKCPCCPTDISEFLKKPQVRRELMDVIEETKKKLEQEDEENSGSSSEGNSESEQEDETEVHVSDDEPATKKMKLSA